MRGGDEIVQPFRRLILWEVAARDREVAGRDPIKATELEHLVRVEACDAASRVLHELS